MDSFTQTLISQVQAGRDPSSILLLEITSDLPPGIVTSDDLDQTQLAYLINRDHDIGVRTAAHVVSTMSNEMQSRLRAGKAIKLKGFGTIKLKYRPPRSFQHPVHGLIHKPGRYIPHFVPARNFKHSLGQEQWPI